MQIPNHIIKNPDFPHYAFHLFLELRNIANKENKITIYPKKLLDKLGWVKNDTLKKHLNILHTFNLISEQITTVHKLRPLEITLTYFDKNFTQVDIETINKIKAEMQEVEWKIKDETRLVNMVSIALRLFYYYEMLFNSKTQCAYPDYKMIYKETGIATNYISLLNKTFENKNLLTIKSGYWFEIEPGKFNMSRNNYVPNCKRK